MGVACGLVTDDLTDEPPGDICEENLGGRGHSKFQCPNSEQLAHLVCFFLSPISAARCWRCSGDKNGQGVIVLPLLRASAQKTTLVSWWERMDVFQVRQALLIFFGSGALHLAVVVQVIKSM